MGKLLPRLLILFSLLVNGFGVASVAHAHDGRSGHVVEHAGSIIDAVHQSEESNPAASLPDHAAPHHHCVADIAPSLADIGNPNFGVGDRLVPVNGAAMLSRAVAPPIEPPAA